MFRCLLAVGGCLFAMTILSKCVVVAVVVAVAVAVVVGVVVVIEAMLVMPVMLVMLVMAMVVVQWCASGDGDGEKNEQCESMRNK